MGQDGGFEERRRSLEEEFFYRENQRLLENLRKMKQMEQSKEALSEASGIQDSAVLDKLMKLKVSAETVAALTVAPLVEVVWADGRLDEKEKEAVKEAAHQCGLQEGDINYQLLETWLEKRPSSHLLETWKHYIQGLCETLSEQERSSLKAELMGRARAVAEASGGLLGLAKISQAEADVIQELETAFD